MMLAVLLAFAPVHATLEVLRAQFDAFECEKVIVGAASLTDDVTLPAADRQEAMFRRAYCMAVIGNVTEAGDAFRTIYSGELAARPPFEMEPRIQFLADAARAEVVARRQDEAAEARRELVARIHIAVTPPENVEGGHRATFAVALTDPDGVVHSMRVDFRKRGEPEFYALPVKKTADGTWRGEVPGSYTRSERGATLEWFVSVGDAGGDPLTSFGSRAAPRELVIQPGSVVAVDVPARERRTHGARLAGALLLTPTLGLVGSFSGFAVGLIVGAFAGQITDDGSTLAGRSGTTAFTTLGGFLGVLLAANEVLDLAPALVVTGASTALCLLGASLVMVVESDEAELVGVGILALDVVATAVVPTVLVALDPPSLE